VSSFDHEGSVGSSKSMAVTSISHPWSKISSNWSQKQRLASIVLVDKSIS
jgi:hypothetical protein